MIIILMTQHGSLLLSERMGKDVWLVKYGEVKGDNAKYIHDHNDSVCH